MPTNTSKSRAVWNRGGCWPRRELAEQGVSTAAADLLTTAELQSEARIYARIMTRLRQQERAYATLQGTLNEASSSLPVLKEQLARQGISAITDKEWRGRAREIASGRPRWLAVSTERNGKRSFHLLYA